MTAPQQVGRWGLRALVAAVAASVLVPSALLGLDGSARVAVLSVGLACAATALGLAVTAWAIALRATEGRWHRALLGAGIGGLVTLPLLGLGGLVLAGALTANLSDNGMPRLVLVSAARPPTLLLATTTLAFRAPVSQEGLGGGEGRRA